MKNRGFTLIEILISITIIILFSGITLAYYNNFTEDQKLKSESKRLISVLALARKMASAGVISDPTQCDISANYVFNGYKVTFTSDSSYTLQQSCSLCVIINDNYVCTPVTAPSIHTYSFDQGLVVKDLPDILFQPLSLGAKSEESIIKLKNNLNHCIDITVGLSTIEESGIITDSCFQ